MGQSHLICSQNEFNWYKNFKPEKSLYNLIIKQVNFESGQSL